MKIISLENTNENTNTLNIKIDEPITVSQLFSKDSVKEFSKAAIIGSITSVDDADASLITHNGDLRGLENYAVTDDTVIEISTFGEKKPDEPVYGKVTIRTGGGMDSRTVKILHGKTTVSQVLTEKIAAALDRSLDTLRNMHININDTKGTLESVLYDGDVIVLEERKAGSNGAGVIQVYDAEGYCRTFDIPAENTTLGEFLESIKDELATDAYDPEYEEPSFEAVSDYVIEVDGEDVEGSSFSDLLFDAPARRFEEVTLSLYFKNDDTEDSEDEESEDEELVAEGVPAEVPQEAQKCGKVTVHQVGTSPISMLVKEGETTLADIVFSDKVLNSWAMTQQQMSSMKFYINDTQVFKMDVLLHVGEDIAVEAPKCGSNGNL